MDLFEVRGRTSLAGEVRIDGAKNAALPIMAASLLTDGESILSDAPDLIDVRVLSRLLITLGVAVRREDGGELHLIVEEDDPGKSFADYELVRRMRASFCVLGPLLARRGRAVVALPGGCQIGTRPVDVHLRGLSALGADLRLEGGYVIAKAPRLVGTTIDLTGPHGSTVTGTCNLLMAATQAEGGTILTGAAREPEVVDLGHYLITCGAQIDGLGTDTIEIEGPTELRGGAHRIIPDRIETGTFLLASAITGGGVTVCGVRPNHLSALLNLLIECGVPISREVDQMRVGAVAPENLRPFDLVTGPHPGLPTDLQAQLMVLASQITGESRIAEQVFPDRFGHVAELARLGATITRRGDAATVHGPSPLSGAEVMASDLRASAALVLAGLAATGTTRIRRIYHLDRGYHRFAEKLSGLGADVRRLPDSADAQKTLPPLTD